MLRFLIRRLGLAVVTLVLVSVTVFLASQILPGDVGRSVLGPYASNAQVAQLDHRLGADRPIVERYWNWVSGFVRGDWGTSPVQGQAVRPLVLGHLRNSLILGIFAMVLVVPLSIALGVIAALHRGRALDRTISIVGLSFVALPEFVLGVTVLVVFAVQLGWLPVSSQVPSANPVDIVRQLLLPSIPLIFVLFAYISRMAREGTSSVLQSNYVRTATLQGVPRRTVVVRHVLRNALLPTITVVSVQMGYLIGGLVVVETLFDYPGIGQLTLNAAVGHDIPTLEAAVLVIALVYLVANTVADTLYMLLDPRVRRAA